MSYQGKLQNPKWQKKRLEILQRDDFKCLHCECDDKELHVHHRWYEFGKDIWDYPDQCFETLCHECHKLIEECIKENMSYINLELRKSVIDQYDYTCILNFIHSLSYDSNYARINPMQISDAIYYIIEKDVIGQIVEMRSDLFK